MTPSHISGMEIGRYKSLKDENRAALACAFEMTPAQLSSYLHGGTLPPDLPESNRLAAPIQIPVYTDFPFHAGTSTQPVEYIQLYGKGRISEVSFETLVEKIRDNILQQEKKLRDLRLKRESMERVTANADKLIETTRVFSNVLHEADYPLQVKALEAFDIHATYTPDKDIVIDGLLPVGVTVFDMKLQVEKRNALPFHFVCKYMISGNIPIVNTNGK